MAWDKGEMRKQVLTGENQKEFGAHSTVWVHLKEICFLIAVGFLRLGVLPHYQTFLNNSSQLLPLEVWY